MSRRRYSEREPSIGEVIAGIIAITIFGGIWILYTEFISNRKVFYFHLFEFIGVLIAGSVVCGGFLISWKRAKERKFSNLLQSLREAGLEEEIKNFILRYRSGKGTKNEVWKYREDKFRNEQLEDLLSHIKDKGFDIDLDKLKEILSYYILQYERAVTIGSLKNAPQSLDSLSGSDFERLLERLYAAKGYQVQMMGGVGDQGGDLIANKPGERILIQAKRYKGSVGNAAVQQAHAAKTYYDCREAVVVTSGYFTREAADLAKINKVWLVGKKDLQEQLLQYLKESWA